MTEEVAQRTALEAAGAIVTATSLALPEEIEWEDYQALGAFIGEMNRACAWWAGDLIVYGENVYGEIHSQIDEVLGLAPQTIANRASVARHIPPNRRRASLPFGVHAEVAYMEPHERDRWLDRAELGKWTRAMLRYEIRLSRGEESEPGGDLALTSAAAGQHGTFLGELVPASTHTCPACGHTF